MLRNGSRGLEIGDSLPSKLTASIVEGFVTNRETKARRGQFTSLNCEFTGCLSKGVLPIIANPCPPPRPPEQGRVMRRFMLPLGAPRKGTGRCSVIRDSTNICYTGGKQSQKIEGTLFFISSEMKLAPRSFPNPNPQESGA